ncbi:MAG: hypothetical protein QOF13_2200 [Solirubrobacterales bacterium]|nr:hypothetical protein [Solirubrobacterales bacterium]
MTIKPFLSHKREDRAQVVQLKHELQLRGVGAWRDVEDLPVGTQTPEAIRAAIRERTGGFLWYGTRRALGSWMVNNVELPVAIERARADPSYPFVPLFVNLTPSRVRDTLHSNLGEENAKFLLNANGLVRGSSAADFFIREAARRYLLDAAASLADTPIAMAVTALREPHDGHDLTLDWSGLLNREARTIAPEQVSRLIGALVDVRTALQRQVESPHLLLDLDLPLPLAVLTGYHWRLTTRMRLDVRQRMDGDLLLVRQRGEVDEPATPFADDGATGGEGPTIVAISCGEPIPGAADRYRESVAGRSVISLHCPGHLSAAQIRGVAQRAARKLGELNDAGREKHLLLRGPASLALLLGASMNAAGTTTVPLWNGSEYRSSLSVGPAADLRPPPPRI